MTIDLYYLPISGPCRSVLMVAKVLNLNLNLIPVDLLKGEHMTPEYLKLNPQHTIPTLVDNDLTIWESHVILSYLVEKYGATSHETLYPKPPKERALVNHRLFFDLDSLYKAFRVYYVPQLFMNQPADPEKYKIVENVFETLDQFLEGDTYVAGPTITIADYAVVASVSSYEAIGFEVSKYRNIQKWYTAMKCAPGYEENEEGYNAIKVNSSVLLTNRE